MYNVKKHQKGITLIALIAGVIIMLILAGVSLNILFDEDIVGATHDAAGSMNEYQATQNARENELIQLIENEGM